MTLKSRLRLTILLPLMAVAVGYSLLSLSTVAAVLFREASERTMLLASQAQTILVQRVTEYLKASPATPLATDKGQDWGEMASQDRALSRLLEETMASTRTVVEIDIRGQDQKIVASSNPKSIGKVARKATPMRDWENQGRVRQIWRVLTKTEEYETIIPLGVQGSDRPLFEVRVLVSSVLLRNTLEPEVRNLFFALGISLLMALALAVLAGNLAFLPLRRLSDAIDRVSRGEALNKPQLEESREVQVVENKLSLLGEQVRGAKEDAKQMRGNVQQLLERMEDAVLLFDQDGKLVNAGRSIEKLLGRDRGELASKHINEMFPVGTSAGDLVQTAMSLKKEVSNVEVPFHSNGNGERTILLDLEVLQDFPTQDTRGYLVTLRDAEAKMSISNQLNVSERLSALNRLTGGVAHEIKNPLNSIGLHLEILKERIAGSDPYAEEELRILREETRRLDRVVKTFLDFTKPVQLKLAPLDLYDLLNGLLQFLLPEAQAKEVKFEMECDVTPATIRGDADLLKQAFLNLLRNGMEAMPTGGPLVLHLKKEGEELLVAIADRGIGIPEESRTKIFQLYFTTKKQGSGIGLAVTYRVVQLHNGSIAFRSNPGEGTIFELRFPLLSDTRVEA